MTTLSDIHEALDGLRRELAREMRFGPATAQQACDLFLAATPRAMAMLQRYTGTGLQKKAHVVRWLTQCFDSEISPLVEPTSPTSRACFRESFILGGGRIIDVFHLFATSEHAIDVVAAFTVVDE